MRVHFAEDFAMGGLSIYITNDEGTAVMVPDSVEGGIIGWREVDVPEGTVAPATLRLARMYAKPFEEGFKRYLGERTHLVPEKVYEREATRVDTLIDALIRRPITDLPEAT